MTTIKITLDAGINVYSTKEFIEEVEDEYWDSLTEQEQYEYCEEVALENIAVSYGIV